MPLNVLDAATLSATVVAFRDALNVHREAINNLNVYPVPDGDTGTNMSLTLRSVVDELDAAPVDLQSVTNAIAHGSLMGARGNSGVIMSQILRGFMEVVAAEPAIDGACFAAALEEAAKGAYKAVGNPVEGTILTVVRESGVAAAAAAANGADLLGVIDAARAEGAALDRGLDDLLAEGLVDDDVVVVEPGV